MYFNEEEMLRVFDEAYGDERMQKGELKINVCKYNIFGRQMKTNLFII